MSTHVGIGDLPPNSYYKDSEMQAEIRRDTLIKRGLLIGCSIISLVANWNVISPIALQALETAANYSENIRFCAEYVNLLDPVVEVVQQTWSNYLSYGLLS